MKSIFQYSDRAAQETIFFNKQKNNFNNLPPIVDWLSERYIKPRVEAIFNTVGPIDFYSTPIKTKCQKTDRNIRIISIGSGDGEIELKIGDALKGKGIVNFLIEGYELSEELVAVSNKNSIKKNLARNIRFVKADFNFLELEPGVDFIIANQILHHISDLEILFNKLYSALTDDGLLMTRDMIGKNGHQAWPEAKSIVDAIWKNMPDRYKFNNRSEELFANFPNTDFSKSSFEGIRSQDILPIMLEKFYFSNYYAFGGIVERFLNRGFGHNYSIYSLDDTSFAIMLQEVNDALLDGGFTTPTQMIGYAKKNKVKQACWRNRTPERSLRDGYFKAI